MKKNSMLLKIGFAFLVCFSISYTSFSQTVVSCNGRLQTKGNQIVGSHGNPVQLRGMSMFWSQWQGQYYTPSTIKWLRDDWKCTVIRAAMGVDANIDGYLKNKDLEKQKIKAVVDACIDLGIYVIIDWHSHYAENQKADAIAFFTEMAQAYGKYPNVMYEIYNEPLDGTSWANTIKPYANDVIKEIRKYDADNLIIVGTRKWSQLVDEAANNPITDVNVAYTLHFYAATTSHQSELRAIAQKALDKGAPLFVTEFGTCEASGNGSINEQQTKDWFAFLDKNKISWCNWAVSDKSEAASALLSGASTSGNWPTSSLTTSGKIVRNELILKYVTPSCSGTNPPTTGQQPYNANPFPIPGTIELEQYDKGGSNVAFFDSDNTNQGTQFRTDGVDIETTQDVSGAYNVGWTVKDEWLSYSTTCTKSGKYNIKVRLASNVATGKFHIEIDGVNVTGIQSVTSTSGWQTWKTVTISNIQINQGNHIVKFYFDGDGVNVNYLVFEADSPLSVTEFENESLTFFPNPFQESFELKTMETVSYKIMNNNGLVLKSGVCEANCRLGQELDPGIYLLNITTHDKTETKRLIKK